VDLKKDKATLGCCLRRPRGVTAQFQSQPFASDQSRACGGFSSVETLFVTKGAFYEPIIGPHRDAPGEPVLRSSCTSQGAACSIYAPGETIHTEISSQVLDCRVPGTGQAGGVHARKSLDRSGAAVQRARGSGRGLGSRLTCGLRPSARVPAGSSRVHAGPVLDELSQVERNACAVDIFRGS